MYRRKFIQMMTLAGASGMATMGSMRAMGDSDNQTVTYHVQGFSCITCAVGLDAMLEREKGIVRSKSSYPAGKVVIAFDPHVVDDATLRGFIAEMGFTVKG